MRNLGLLCLALAACGGSTHTSTADDSGQSATDDGGSTAGDASSGTLFATPFFPLDPGLSWTYKQTKADGTLGTSCENDGSTLTITMGAVNSNGAHPAMYQPACFYASIDYLVSGNQVTEGGYIAYEFPPSQSLMWGAGGASGATYEWDQHLDTYTVAAGTFSDCWHMSINGGGSEQVLCKNVGTVLSAGTQFQGYRWELVSKNF